MTNTLLCPGTDIVTVVDAIVINPVNPIADFSASGLSVGQPTLFTDNSNYNPISWEWNFGDGGTSTLQTPSNTYANPGIYTVQLIVNNCAGADTIVQQIEVYSTIIMCNETSTNKTNIGSPVVLKTWKVLEVSSSASLTDLSARNLIILWS